MASSLENAGRFAQRVLVGVTIAVFMARVAWLLFTFSQVLLFIFGGILFAILLDGAASFIARRTGLWRGVSLALVVLLIAAAVVGACWLFGARAAGQFQTLYLQDILGNDVAVLDANQSPRPT